MTKNLKSAALAALALLLLSGCAAPAAEQPAATVEASSSAEPSPTATPAPAASIPFEGDCAQALSDEEVALLGSQAVESLPRTLSTIEPDLGASLALIGGMSCIWQTDTGFVTIAVFPSSVVPPSVAEPVAGMSCDDSGNLCSGSTVVADAWLHAYGSDEAAATGALERVAERVALISPPHPVAASSDWWSIPACAELTSAVESASGVPALEAGFPGDSVPSGVSWDTGVANGVTAWCPWYSYAGDQGYLVELDIQPGIGVPGAAELAEASGAPVDIAGADHAFLIPQATGQGTVRIIAVSGPNRLTVTGGTGVTQASLSAVAAGALAALDEG